MDWSKAKSILIFVFLGLNIFLIINLGIINLGDSTNKEVIVSTMEILKNRGVTIDCDIPLNNSATPMLNFEAEGIDRERVANYLLGATAPNGAPKDGEKIANGDKEIIFVDESSFEFTDSNPKGSLGLNGRKSAEKELAKYVEKLPLTVSELYLDSYTEKNDGTVTAVFKERYSKQLVFDNSITVSASKAGVIKLYCSYRKVKGLASTENTKAIPSYEILLKNYNSEKGAVIKEIALGWYKGSKVQPGTKVFYAPPVWRVRTDNGGDRFFNAYTGEEVK